MMIFVLFVVEGTGKTWLLVRQPLAFNVSGILTINLAFNRDVVQSGTKRKSKRMSNTWGTSFVLVTKQQLFKRGVRHTYKVHC